MSIKVMNRVWDHSKANGTPLLVLLCLADWADDDGECWPSIARIAKKCRLKDERHVKRVIHDTLEQKLGEVLVIPGGGKSSAKGGMRSNRYRITVHMPEETRVADKPPLAEDDGGSQTTPDSGSGTTHDGGSQTTQIVVDRPPEPSLNHQGDSSALPVDSSLVGNSLTRAEIDRIHRRKISFESSFGRMPA